MLTELKIPSSSAEICANYCLNMSSFNSLAFQCLSFDYCGSKQACVFYNFSLSTDPNVIIESSDSCDHYSSFFIFLINL